MFAASRFRRARPLAAALLLAASSCQAARAQADGPAAAPLAQQLAAPLGAGDLAVTGFSGAKLATPNLPAGVDPTTLTTIDGDGAALRIFELSTLGGPTLGQVVAPPVKLTIPARDIGQVFALTFDDGAGPSGTGVPNLYTASSSLFGLQIVGAPGADGAPTRLKQGAPGARFMAGQFGALPGAGPGAIWRIDGTTGAATSFAQTPANAGPGVGDLAIDRRSRTLYASDLDTGLIHRFSLDAAPATDLGSFDHGMSGRPGAQLPSIADDGAKADIASPAFKADDPATWGFTQPERRVVALAVRGGRLYYSVAAGPEIWSVELGPDGAFGVTARRELLVQADRPFAVTDIVFDDQGRMILAQRGTQKSPFDYGQFVEPAAAATLRYVPAPPGGADLWQAAPEEYAIGLPDGSRMGSGGLALHRGFNPDGSIGPSCEQTLLTTGDDLRDTLELAATIPPGPLNVHGVQINDSSLVRPANVPPLQSAFMAFDPDQIDPDARGRVGDVEAIPCLGQLGEALPVEPGFELPPAIEGAFVAPPLVFPEDFGPLEPLPGGGGFALAKQALTETCTQDGGCAFGITVFNPGPDPLPGPIQLDEIFTVGGVKQPEAAIIGAPNAPWECTDGANVNCIHPGPLPVGETVLTLNFKPGPLGDAKEVKNCVALAGELDDDLPPVIEEPNDQDKKDKPAKEDRKPTVPAVGNAKEGFKLEMKPGQACADKGGCKLEFTVENASGAPFMGKMSAKTLGTSKTGGQNTDPADKFADKFTVQKADAPPGFACKANAGDAASSTVSVCEADAVTLQPGEKKTFTIEVQPEQRGIAGRPVDELSMVASVSLSSPGKNVTLLGQAGVVVKTPDEQAAEANEAKKDPKGKPNGKGGEAVDTDDLPPEQCATIAIEDPKGGGGKDKPEDPKGGGGKDKPEDPKGGGGGKTEPPADVADLEIEKINKAAACTEVGGGCTFEITVRNPGKSDFPGPIVVEDVVTIDGQELRLKGLQSGTGDWTCVTPANGRFTCTHPGSLKAGEKISFPISPILGLRSGHLAMKNCATVKGGKQNSCSSIPFTQTDEPLLRVIKEKLSGDCAPLCTFKISVQNIGQGDFKGPLVVFDAALGADGTAIEFQSKLIDANGFTCSSPRLSSSVCNAENVSLSPDQQASFTVEAAAISTNFAGTNCVNLIGKAAPFEQNSPNRCVPIQRTGVGETPNPNLKISKTISNPDKPENPKTGHCDHRKNCSFNITISNEGTGTYVGPIEISDTVPEIGAGGVAQPIPAGVEGVANPDWECRKPANRRIACISKTRTLAPKQSVSLTVLVTPGAEWKKLNVLTNCAFVFAAGNDKNAVTIDNNDCATIKLDPFDVKVKKSGGQNCQAGGDCTFVLNLFNPGPIDHDEPVTISDKLDIGTAQIVSITPPLPCATQPTQIPFTCTSPGPVPLSFDGEDKIEANSKTFTMVVKMPEGAQKFTNCASVSGAAGQTAPADAQGDESCVSSDLAPKDPGSGGSNPLQPQTDPAVTPPVTPTPPPAQCFGDMVASASGRCACPAGTRFNGRACAPVGGGVTPTLPPVVIPCPAGTFGTYPNCRVGSGGSNGVRPSDEACPRGTVGAPPNCRSVAPPPCPRGTAGDYPNCRVVAPSPAPQCPPGTSGRFPNCRAVAAPQPSCPPGTVGRYPRCRVKQPDAGGGGSNGVNPGPDPVCPEGTTGRYPRCRPIEARPACPDGTIGRYPRCRAIDAPEPAQCRGDMVGSPPNCSCPAGTRPAGRSFRCVTIREVPDEVRECPAGTSGRYPRCFRDRPTPQLPAELRRCLHGQVGTPPNCSCPAGMRYRNDYCRPIDGSGPDNGGTVRPPRPRPQPQPQQCPPGSTPVDGGGCRSDLR